MDGGATCFRTKHMRGCGLLVVGEEKALGLRCGPCWALRWGPYWALVGPFDWREGNWGAFSSFASERLLYILALLPHACLVEDPEAHSAPRPRKYPLPARQEPSSNSTDICQTSVGSIDLLKL